MNIRPLHDRVIVRRMEEERTSPGGIVLPASPGFYHGNTSAQGLIDFVVGKALDSIGLTDHNLFKRWKSGDDDA